MPTGKPRKKSRPKADKPTGVNSARELERAETYIAALKPILRIQDWAIDIDNSKPASEACLAEIHTQYQLSAEIWLCADWEALTDDIKATTLAHECVHIVTRPLHTVAEAASEQSQGFGAQLIQGMCEDMTENLTQILKPYLPKYPR